MIMLYNDIEFKCGKNISGQLRALVDFIYTEELSSLERKIADSLSPERSFSFVTSGLIETLGNPNLELTRRHLRQDNLFYMMQGERNQDLNALWLKPKSDPSSIWNDESIKNGFPKYIQYIGISIFALFYMLFCVPFFVSNLNTIAHTSVLLYWLIFAFVYSILLSYMSLFYLDEHFLDKNIRSDSRKLSNVFLDRIFYKRRFIKTFAINVYLNKTSSIERIKTEYQDVTGKNLLVQDGFYYVNGARKKISPKALVVDIVEHIKKSSEFTYDTYDTHRIYYTTHSLQTTGNRIIELNEFLSSDTGAEALIRLENTRLKTKYLSGDTTNMQSHIYNSAI